LTNATINFANSAIGLASKTVAPCCFGESKSKRSRLRAVSEIAKAAVESLYIEFGKWQNRNTKGLFCDIPVRITMLATQLSP
jgi:hypothetical protein